MKPINLNNHPKIKSGFTVPEGYFESFSAELLTQIKDTDRKVVPIKSRVFIRLSAAATIILFLGVGAYFYFFTKSEIDYTDQIELYLSANPEITTHDIISYMDYSDVSSLEAKHNLQAEDIEGFFIENYIVEDILTQSSEN